MMHAHRPIVGGFFFNHQLPLRGEISLPQGKYEVLLCFTNILRWFFLLSVICLIFVKRIIFFADVYCFFYCLGLNDVDIARKQLSVYICMYIHTYIYTFIYDAIYIYNNNLFRKKKETRIADVR